ncbi:MAG: SdpI family protein [Huintestinicola sp.]|uniref:SdpI family protein n=1 Tax=Huintestinicola sp. TaxID=2981661 RepID=UPI003EFD8E58
MFEIIFTSLFMLLLPLTMVICGGCFLRSPPEPESGIGYRTRRSMTSAETWLAAHRICGRLWLISGIVTLIIALIGGVFAVVTGMEADGRLYNVMLIEEAVQLALLLGAIPVTESRLKKMFHI